MKRGDIIWGLGTVIILFILSILTMILSNSCSGFFLCIWDIIFFIINFPGMVIFLIISTLGFFNVDQNNPPSDMIMYIVRFLVIIISLPIHFIIGILLRRLVK